MAQKATIGIEIQGKQAEGSVRQLNENIEQVAQSTQSVRAELRQLTQQLQSGTLTGEAFIQARDRAAQLKDTIGDTTAEINILAGTTTEALGRGLTSVAQIGVQGFQGVMGAAAMFGVESENLQKTMVALQGAMALSQSIEFFGGIGDKMNELRGVALKLGQSLGLVAAAQTEVAVATEIAAVAETEQTLAIEAGAAAQTTSTVATEGATVATTALGTAMKALPIFLIIAGIAALGVALYQTSQQANKGKLSNEEYKKVLDGTRGSLEDAYLKLDKVRLAFDMARAGTISKEKALKIYNTTLGGTFGMATNLNQAEKLYVAKTEAYIEATMLRAEANALLQIAAQKQAESITAGQEDQTSWLDKTIAGTKAYVAVMFNSTDGMIDASVDLASAQADGVKAITDQNDAVIKNLRAKAKQNLTQAEGIETQAGLNMETDDGTKITNTNTGAIDANSDAQDKLNKKLEERRKLLEKINSDIQRETDAANQLRDLNIDREQIQADGDAKVFALRNKHQQSLAKVDLDFEKFKEDLIRKATDREVKALEERFVNGTMTEQEYRTELQRITTNGADNLFAIERELLGRKQDLRDDEQDKIKEALEKNNEDAYMSSQKLYLTLGQSKVQFDKTMALKEIEFSNKTDEEKKKARLEVLKYYADTEIYQIKEIANQDLKILEAKYDEEIKLAKENGESTAAIEAKFALDKVNLEQDAANKIKDIQNALIPTSYESPAEKVLEGLQKYGQMVMEVATAIDGLLAQQAENRLRRIDEQYAHEETKLKELYDSKVLSEEEYNDKLAELEQQRAEEALKIKRKEFQRQKALNVADAIMNGALAITSILAQYPKFDGGFAMFAALAAAGITNALQIATISQQQFTAARGGIVPGNGLPNDVDSINAKLAPGEAIINARSTAMFGNTLSMINQAGGGIPLAPEMLQQGMSGSGTIFNDNQPQTIKAYVVETEITDTQRRVNRIQSAAEF